MAGLTEGQDNKTCMRQGFEDSRFELRDPISPSFHCPICMNVLNDPVMCRDNQHYFCRACITEHLKNAHNCPTCQDELSADTLVKAPRIVIEYLSELRIHCDFFSRGCRDVVQLNALERHVSMCGFAAVKCTNEGCDVVVNRQDKLHHEAEVCEFRRLQCHDCVELKKAVKCMNEKIAEDIAKLHANTAKLQKQVEDLGEKMSTMCEMQTEVVAEVKRLNQMISGQQLTARRSIIIAGGEGRRSKSTVEIFTWPQKTWTLQNPMSTCRAHASAVVYQGEVIISGGNGDKGKNTDTMETSCCDEPFEWNISPVKLSTPCRNHAAVMYKDMLLLCGGVAVDGKNKIYEISMVPPYSTKILTTMPAPRRDHTMALFEDKVFIFGGYSGIAHDTVMMFDTIVKEWKIMPPLPFAVDDMATVLWQNNVIVVGGGDGGGSVARDTVVMYNLTSGESKYLPSMKYHRRGCSAVVTGDVLVVMGGFNERNNCLKSVEAFSFERRVWEELPDMNEARAFASAVVKPN